jgi:hypothetical protein
MLSAAMLAMVLVAAAPVLGQGFVNQSANQFGVVDDSVCSQVYNIAVQQYNAGDQYANADAFANADATAGAFGTAAAAAIAGANAANIANAAGINVDTVNVCLNNFTVTATPTAKTVTPKATVHPKKKVVFVKGKKVVPEKVISVKGKKHVVVVEGKTVTATATATAKKTATAKVAGQVQYKKTVTATATPTATATALPPTGGLTSPGAFALGAGALLIIGGLVARRIIQ